MSYAQFKSEYIQAFNRIMKYAPDEIGFGFYAEKMATLADEYPEFADALENE